MTRAGRFLRCPSCGARQVPRTPYCERCLCPVAALAPPRALGPRHGRPQRLPRRLPGARRLLSGAALGLLLGWLPPPAGTIGCVAAVALGGAALGRCRRRRAPTWAAWAVMLLGAAAGVSASATFW